MMERDFAFCQHLCMNWPSWADGGTLNQLTVTLAAPALSSRTNRPAWFVSSSGRTSLRPCSTSQGWCVQGDNGNAMKISENAMKVVGVFFVGSPSLLSVQSNGLLFPNVSLPFRLPERGLPHFGVDGRSVEWLWWCKWTSSSLGNDDGI